MENNEQIIMGSNCGMAALLIVGLLIGIIFLIVVL